MGVLILSALPALAANGEEGPLLPLPVERPFRAITPHTLGPRRVQLESEMLTYVIDEGGDQHTVAVNTMTWRLGVTETHEGQLTLESFKTGNKRRNPGVGDAILHWKKKIAGAAHRGWSWGVKASLRLPTGAEIAEERRLRAEALSPLAWAWNENAVVQSALGVSVGRGVDHVAKQATLIGSLGLQWRYGERLYLMTEATDEWTTEGPQYNRARAMAGFGVVPAHGMRLDLGTRIGMTAATEDLSFFFGLVTGVGI